MPRDPSRRVPFSDEVTFTNHHLAGITWSLDDSCLRAAAEDAGAEVGASPIFFISPKGGDLAPGDSVTLRVTFSPAESQDYEYKLPLYLEGEKTRPYLTLTLRGSGVFPRLSFDVDEVTLPTVPLGGRARALLRDQLRLRQPRAHVPASAARAADRGLAPRGQDARHHDGAAARRAQLQVDDAGELRDARRDPRHRQQPLRGRRVRLGRQLRAHDVPVPAAVRRAVPVPRARRPPGAAARQAARAPTGRRIREKERQRQQRRKSKGSKGEDGGGGDDDDDKPPPPSAAAARRQAQLEGDAPVGGVGVDPRKEPPRVGGSSPRSSCCGSTRT